jgi:ADP-ribose pyrophosphatase
LVIEQKYGREDQQLIERETCYAGFFRMERFHFRFRKFNGDWSRKVTREVMVRGVATCALPYDPVSGEVVLIEQIRAGALLEDSTPWLIELVAGINDKNESSEELIRREAMEEAGLEVLGLRHVIDYLPSPGGSTEKVNLYCIHVDAGMAEGVFGLDEEDEDILVHRLPFEQAMILLREGRISNAPAIIALQWLALNRSSVDLDWLAERG